MASTTRLLLLTVLLSIGYNVNCSSHRSCTGTKACLKYDGKVTHGAVVKLYWYDTVVKGCVALEKDCSHPNSNVTFTSMEDCLKICTDKFVPSSLTPNECESSSGNCDKDLPPTSSSSSTSSSLGRKWSVMVSMMCGVGIVALVVVVVATTYAVRIQKNKESHRKKKLENMLNTLSDPNGSSSDDDEEMESYGDPEEDNLFDRLERCHQYTHHSQY